MSGEVEHTRLYADLLCSHTLVAHSAASLPLISTSAAPLNWQLLVNLQEIAATHLSDNPRKVLLCKETLELKKITYQSKKIHVSKIKCEVVAELSLGCSAATKEEKKKPTHQQWELYSWQWCVRVWKNSLTWEKFSPQSSQMMKANEIEILELSVLFITFCRVKYPLAGTRRCKLTCSQFDAVLRVWSRAMTL